MAPSLCAYQVPCYSGADSTLSCLNHDIFIVFNYYKYVRNSLKPKSLSWRSAELRQGGSGDTRADRLVTTFFVTARPFLRPDTIT